ncbi:MAG TPA: RNA 2',3'-cyclic phosphodiesterase [Pyrinomonadaceae bacterium]|nr:RNA 2',3'-cyclic phosphodiesterase [Pyrinomonadaceae bacterium]
MSEEWRTFCAVELSAEVRAQLQDHVRVLREAVPEAVASWSKPENVHLTLKFFGNVPKEKVPRISDVAARVASQFSSFTIGIGGTGAFPKVLWIGVKDPTGRLTELQRQLDAETFPKEDRSYKPHLTIARLRHPEGARKLRETHLQTKFDLIDVPVKEFVVFRSQLNPKGSIYTAISKHELPR